MRFKTLHESIIFVLKNKKDNTSTFEDISNEIKKLELWKRPSDNLFPQAYQIRLRTVVAKKYKTLFTFIEPDTIVLKHS